MPATQFDKQEMAKWHADRHLATDPGIEAVYYLPANSPEREIRFLEINSLIAIRDSDPLEPIDFGVDIDGADPHTLLVLDATPSQWERIRRGELALPEGWSLDGAIAFRRTPFRRDNRFHRCNPTFALIPVPTWPI
jgi:hypothetical protein